MQERTADLDEQRWKKILSTVRMSVADSNFESDTSGADKE